MDGFVGEIRLFSGSYAPQGWLLCNGSQLAISAYDVLFSLLGTRYGGDGVNTFNLPDLRGRVPLGFSSATALASTGGCEQVALAEAQAPAHSHTLFAASTTGGDSDPSGRYPGASEDLKFWLDATDAPVALAAGSVSRAGGAGAPHANIQPFQCLNYIICIEGEYPTRP